MSKKKIDIEDYFKKKKRNDRSKRVFLSIFFVCFTLACCIYFVDLYMKGNNLTFVRFRINPEFGFIIDGNNKVVNFITLNKDASDIYKKDMFEGLKSDEAVDKAISVAKENNYLADENSNRIEVTVMREEEDVKKEIEEKIIKDIKDFDSTIVTDFKEASDEELETFIEMTAQVKKVTNKVEKEPVKPSGGFTKPSGGTTNTVNTYKNCKHTIAENINLSGSNRYETAINVSNAMFPNNEGAKGVILVKYNDLTDTYPAILLSKVMRAPILYVGNSNDDSLIHSNTLNEIEGIMGKAGIGSKVYIVGGGAGVETKLNKYRVSRLSGGNRISTSLAVANEVYQNSKFDSIILAPYDNENVDAALVAGSAASAGYPIIYNNVNMLNGEVSDFIKTKKIKKVYIVGKGKFTNIDAILSSLEKLSVSHEFISGSDRYETSALAVKKFNSSFKNVVLVNNLVDIVTASSLAARTNSAVLYASPYKGSATTLVNSQLSLLDNKKDISKLYYLGGNDIKYAYRELSFKVKERNVSSCAEPDMELLFSKSKAVFYVPHQDDETLYYGQTITAAIHKLGADNVYVILLTDGAASAAQKNTKIVNALNNYNKNNNPDLTFSSARDNEYREALKAMGVKEERILFAEDFNFTRFKDGGYTTTNSVYKKQYADTLALMKLVDTNLKGDVTHFTYSYLDEHNDHEGMGNALTQLYYDKNLTDDNFKDVYLIVKNTEMVDDIKHVKTENKNTVMTTYIHSDYDVVLDYKGGFKNIQTAFTKFGYVKGKSDCQVNGKLLGIGCVSVRSLFETIGAKIDEGTLKTVIHIPYNNPKTDEALIDYAKSKLAGKTVSIYGDSISSFDGYSNNSNNNRSTKDNAAYYSTSYSEIDKNRYFIKDVNHTWWKRVTDRLGLKLLVNNSYTGDTVSGSRQRYKQLHNNSNKKPDVIFVYIGTNDLIQNVSVSNFETAYNNMLTSIKKDYPKAEVFVLNLIPNRLNTSMLSSYNNTIKKLANKHKVNLVDISSKSGIRTNNYGNYMCDVNKVHPSYDGMAAIANATLKAISEKYTK